MKKLILLFSIFFLFACGKTNGPASQNGNSTITNQSALVNMDGTITIPAQGMVGGAPSIYFNSVQYIYSSNGSSSAAQNYFNSLSNHQVNVWPIFQNANSTQYRIHFTGSFAQGPCPFNPTAMCQLALVQSMVAY